MMKLIYSLLTLLLACFVYALVGQPVYPPPDLEKFERDEIVPLVLPRTPNEMAYVVYSGGRNVNLGNVLTPSEVTHAPSVSFTADRHKNHTLIMVDPDAPSRKNPFYKEWLHWLVVNIPGTNISEGETLAAYMPPDPRKDTGLHRYIFVVYEQPSGNVTFRERKLGPKQTNPTERAYFSVWNFASGHYLGDPLAGNYFLSKWVEWDVDPID